VHLGGAEF